jgi:gamma-glutamyltranspeptidase/glutathione hydrolase
MNNEMDDFSSKPGVPNGFGLIGGEANAIQPTKRPLSSMTPTMILKDGKPYVVVGSPGGSRIITTVLQVIVNIIDHDMGIAEAVHAPRVHHQWLPDVFQLEPGFSPDTVGLLKAMGQNVESSKTMGSVQSIMYKDGLFYGVSDPRRPGAGTVASK